MYLIVRYLECCISRNVHSTRYRVVIFKYQLLCETFDVHVSNEGT